MSNMKSKFETKCRYFNDCHFNVDETCENCNVYLYTHNFVELVIKLQKHDPKEVQNYLNYFSSLLLA